MLITSFFIANRWRLPRDLLKDDWLEKAWSTHSMKPSSAWEREEMVTQAATQVNPEDRTLNKISQLQRETTCTILFIQLPRVASSKCQTTECDFHYLQRAENKVSLLFHGYIILVLQKQKCLDVSYITPLNCAFKTDRC